MSFALHTTKEVYTSQLSDDLGIAKVPVPAESHWQHGRVERKVQLFQTHVLKLLDTLPYHAL